MCDRGCAGAMTIGRRTWQRCGTLLAKKPNNVLDEERTGDSSFLLVAEVLPHDPLAIANLNLVQLPKTPQGSATRLHDVVFRGLRVSERAASRRARLRVQEHLQARVLAAEKRSSSSSASPDHARCRTCDRYAGFRSKATPKEQKDNICANHAQRIVDIFADRDTEAFFDRLGIESDRLRYAQEVVPTMNIQTQTHTD